MLGALLPAAILAGGAPIQSAPAAEPGFAVLVLEFTTDAKFVGFPTHCPGATPEEDADPGMICTAALYEGRVRIVRRISGPKSIGGRLLRYNAHAYPMREGMQLLVVAVPRHDRKGMYSEWWRMPARNGSFCLGTREAKSLGIEPRWLKWGEEQGEPQYRVRCLRL